MSEVPEEYVLPDTDEALLAECEVQVFRATGPGGQSVNTTDSAVRLIHKPTGMVVVARRERSQLRNKIDAVRRPRAPRHATKPSWGAVQRRLTSKSKLSAKKSIRRKPASDD